jgi:hypothetical protein
VLLDGGPLRQQRDGPMRTSQGPRLTLGLGDAQHLRCVDGEARHVAVVATGTGVCGTTHPQRTLGQLGHR